MFRWRSILGLCLGALRSFMHDSNGKPNMQRFVPLERLCHEVKSCKGESHNFERHNWKMFNASSDALKYELTRLADRDKL